MADIHPEAIALIEAGPRRVMDLSLDSIDPSRLETPEEFARRVALRQHEIDERENADLRKEIDRHHESGRELASELADLRAKLEAEHDIRADRETVITLLAESLKVNAEPHQSFFDRLC